jgi:hypothetical protein
MTPVNRGYVQGSPFAPLFGSEPTVVTVRSSPRPAARG